jgi:hypothetical protein
VRQSRQTRQTRKRSIKYDLFLAIRSFSINVINTSKIPTAVLWISAIIHSNGFLIIHVHTLVSPCRSLSLMPFQCLRNRKKAGCSRGLFCNGFHSLASCFDRRLLRFSYDKQNASADMYVENMQIGRLTHVHLFMRTHSAR